MTLTLTRHTCTPNTIITAWWACGVALNTLKTLWEYTMTIKIQDLQERLSIYDKGEEDFILGGLSSLMKDGDLNYHLNEAQIHIEYLSALVDMMTLFIKENVKGMDDNEN